MKRHLAGETEEARRDLERLAIIRKKREEAAQKRIQEGRNPGMSAHGLPSDDDDEDDDSDEDEDDSDEDDNAKKPAAAAAKLPAMMSEAQAKKKAAALGTTAAAPGEELPKLKAMDIKKMNGDALKEALKERNLSLQGQKKDLMQRLLDYEATRN